MTHVAAWERELARARTGCRPLISATCDRIANSIAWQVYRAEGRGLRKGITEALCFAVLALGVAWLATHLNVRVTVAE
jgi:hypothetical protein